MEIYYLQLIYLNRVWEKNVVHSQLLFIYVNMAYYFLFSVIDKDSTNNEKWLSVFSKAMELEKLEMWSEDTIMPGKANNKKWMAANFRVMRQDEAGIKK